MLTRANTEDTTAAKPAAATSEAATASVTIDSATAETTPEVEDVTADELWTASSARSTTEMPPLRQSQRGAKRTTAEALAEARKGKKKLAKKADPPVVTTAVTEDSPVPASAPPSKPSAVDAAVSKTPSAADAVVAKKSSIVAPKKKSTSSTPAQRKPSGFDLTEFMASFSPGLVSPEVATTAAEPAEDPVQAPVDPEPEVDLTTELQHLKTEIAMLKGQLHRGSAPRFEAVPFPGAGTHPNARGELPPPEVCFLSSSSFPEEPKHSKGDYHPPQVHMLAVNRMFKTLASDQALDPSGNIESHSSNNFELLSSDINVSVNIQTTPATCDSVHADTHCTHQDDVAACSSAAAQDLPPRPPVPEHPFCGQRCRRVHSVAEAHRLNMLAEQRNTLLSRMRNLMLSKALSRIGLALPTQANITAVQSASSTTFLLNKPLRHTLSEFVRRTKMPLSTFVELVRGQTNTDYRPNKAIVPAVLDQVCAGYKHLEELQVLRPQRPLERVNVLRKNIRKKQDAWRCLVLDENLFSIWPEVIISPFGIVDKSGGDPTTTGRTIHDLSFPDGTSINDCTNQESVPRPVYSHCDAVAAELLRQQDSYPGATVKIMAGDVSSAFRHVSIHSDSVHLFAGRIEEEQALVIEPAAPFGWTGSPAAYKIFGGAISFVHGSHTNTNYSHGFFNYHWVDDHIKVVVDTGSNCSDADRSLRYAMTAVLGADAINDDKFTSWDSRQTVLGLQFDTVTNMVSMPESKILKTRRIVAATFHAATLTRKEYRSLLGSLRHVASCIRSARPFLQRLHHREAQLHRFQHVQVSDQMKQDLVWWWLILHSPDLNGVAFEFFHGLSSPNVDVETDASDYSLCALDVDAKTAITSQFSPEERPHSSPQKRRQEWRPPPGSRPLHIHFRIDNTSAIAWQNRLGSRNPCAQDLIRQFGFWEISHRLRFSASHIAGVDNVRADAGSRLAARPSYGALYRSLTPNWLQETPRTDALGLENLWHSIFERTPLPTPHTPSTLPPSRSGSRGLLDGRFIRSWLVSAVTPAFRTSPISFYSAFNRATALVHPSEVHLSWARSKVFGISLLSLEPSFQTPTRTFVCCSRVLASSIPLACTKLRFRSNSSSRASSPCAFMTLLNKHYVGMMCLAFFFLLRRSEIVAVSGSTFQWFAVKTQDISILDASGVPTRDPTLACSVHVRLHGSKTNQGGDSTARMLFRSGHKFLCPVFGSLMLLHARKNLPLNIPAAVYMSSTGRPACVSTADIAKVVKTAAAQVGEDPRRFSSHSFRAGGATHMYRSDVDALTIQFHGRWASDAFKRYTSLCQESITSLAAKMASGSKGDSTLH